MDQLEDVTIELTEDTYQPEGDQFKLRVKNNSEESITYGVAYALEYYNEEIWIEVEPDEELAFIAIAQILYAGEEAVEEVDMELGTGRYRLIRQINGGPLAVEFEVIKINYKVEKKCIFQKILSVVLLLR